MGVLCPQTIWSRVSPKTAATLSRSVGLGVQRPRRIASTRCSSSPARSASCLPSSPCSTHRSLTVLVGSIGCTSPCFSRAPAELRPVPLDVLDRRGVPPGDLPRGQAEGARDALSLLRTGRVAPVHDRLQDAPLQPRGGQELVQVKAAFGHPLGDTADPLHNRALVRLEYRLHAGRTSTR